MTAFRKPRLTCPHCGSVFVIEKPGNAAKNDEVTPTADDDAHGLIRLKSQDWFENFWAYYLDDNLDQCRRMITLARTTECWLFDAAKAAPTLANLRGMRLKIDITTEAWNTWRRHLSEHGLRFDQNMLPAWVWVPSEWPQQDVKTARVG